MSYTLQTRRKSLHIVGCYLITRQSPFQWSQTAGFRPLFDPGCVDGWRLVVDSRDWYFVVSVRCALSGGVYKACALFHWAQIPQWGFMGFEYHICDIREYIIGCQRQPQWPNWAPPVASVAEKRKKRNIQKGYDFQKAKRFSRPVDI